MRVTLLALLALAACQPPPSSRIPAPAAPPPYVPVLQRPPAGTTPQAQAWYLDMLAIAHMAGCGGWSAVAADALYRATEADPATHRGLPEAARFALRTLAQERGIMTARRTCDADAKARAHALWGTQAARARANRARTGPPPSAPPAGITPAPRPDAGGKATPPPPNALDI